MDFNDTPEEAAFRAECRTWLEANAEVRQPGDPGADALGERTTPELVKEAFGFEFPNVNRVTSPISHHMMYTRQVAEEFIAHLYAHSKQKAGIQGAPLWIYFGTKLSEYLMIFSWTWAGTSS